MNKYVLIGSSLLVAAGLGGCKHSGINVPDASQFSSKQEIYKYYRSIDGFPGHMPATGNTVFVFDPERGQYAVYDAGGSEIASGRASGGSTYCPDVGRACKTPRGIFTVSHKKGYECRSSKYPLGKGGAHMPYCMYFHSAGYAIHGHKHVPDYNASHGCIRLYPDDAKWLSENVIYAGTKVIVRDY